MSKVKNRKKRALLAALEATEGAPSRAWIPEEPVKAGSSRPSVLRRWLTRMFGMRQ